MKTALITRVCKPLAVVGITAVIAATSLPAYATDIYIRFPDIKGESLDEDHRNWSDLISIDWSSRPAEKGRNGVPVFDDIIVVKEFDAAAPLLQQAFATGIVIPRVNIEVVDELGDLRQVYEFYSVKVTSYSINGSGLDDGPSDNFSETLSLGYEGARSVVFPLNPNQPPVEWIYSRLDQ